MTRKPHRWRRTSPIASPTVSRISAISGSWHCNQEPRRLRPSSSRRAPRRRTSWSAASCRPAHGHGRCRRAWPAPPPAKCDGRPRLRSTGWARTRCYSSPGSPRGWGIAGASHQRTAQFPGAIGRDRQRFVGRRRQGRDRAGDGLHQSTDTGAFPGGASDAGKALAADPDNVDLEAALAAHLLRGIQSAWYNPADVTATERSAQSMLERALQAKPAYLPVLEGYCRFLTATTHFVESLIACAKTLALDPWDGLALFNLGMTQIQLGRFEDALATFKQADQFNTPEVSRWTWLLGAGWTTMLMGRNEEALPWLQRSIAITPGTGRTHLLLAGAYQKLGRRDEAKAAMARAMELRPGSTAGNVLLPSKNVSTAFLEAAQRVLRTEVEAGLPEH